MSFETYWECSVFPFINLIQITNIEISTCICHIPVNSIWLWMDFNIFPSTIPCWSFIEKVSVMQDPDPKWVHIFRWSVQIQIYPPCKTVSASRSSIAWSMSSVRAHLKWSTCQMKCTDSDILPIWNSQWQEIKSLLICVFNESPFKTVTELGQVFRWSEQLGQLVRWSAHWDQIYPLVVTSCGKEQN